jgi:hypothetical protein
VAVFWTALVGLAGIAAAFFAPPWTERLIAKRRDAADFRQARRLVAQELYNLMMELRSLAEMDHMWSPESIGFLRTPAWDAYGPVLARALVNEDEPSWLLVALVYQNIARLAKSLELGEEFARAFGEAEKMNDERRATLVETAKDAERARDALATEPGHGTLEQLFPSPSKAS